MSEPKDIGGGWYENVDPASGRNYYSNATTNETTWEWPEGLPKPCVGGCPRAGGAQTCARC